MQIKVTMRNGDVLTMPSLHGESARSWLNNARRSGNKITHVGNVAVMTAEILDAVDEVSRVGQANMEGI